MMLIEKYGSLEAINRAHGLHEASVVDIYLPMQEVDWHETVENAWQIRWRTLTRAYKAAFNQVTKHKRSLWNTFVFCASSVFAALFINPLCAYALSRFNLPGTHKILLFLLATMAFPVEVTMIPNFLLLKNFPLVQIICCLAGAAIGGALFAIMAPTRRWLPILAGILIGGGLGVTVVAQAYIDLFSADATVSLLNTYWALILPGAASGYSIFILKGFFDSLPQELYETAVIDGAGEFLIFSQITLPMSGPVLAVIGFWAFTASYGSFTWALIVCQNDNMWTLMVHLYQYQMYADPCEQLAALVIASIPTLVVFLVVQKIILQGIILPTYK
jgi:ABC-type glycerol-3-phosphate transport system permease component